MKSRFYICRHCGNVVGMVKNSGVPVKCCGEDMQLLVPNTTDASTEKHLPCISIQEGVLSVTVGSALHPMTAEHFIEWIYVETDKGGQRKILQPTDQPQVTFCLGKDKPIAVYAYCNLHGLWMTELN